MKPLFNPLSVKKFVQAMMSCCTVFLIAILPLNNSKAQTTPYAGTYAELSNAITASANGDIMSITRNLVA